MVAANNLQPYYDLKFNPCCSELLERHEIIGVSSSTYYVLLPLRR